MDTLDDIIERSLALSKELRLLIASAADATPLGNNLERLAQAHTTNVLNQVALLAHISLHSENGAADEQVGILNGAAQEMVKQARKLNEHVAVSGLTKRTATVHVSPHANKVESTPTASSSYKSASVEEEKEVTIDPTLDNGTKDTESTLKKDVEQNGKQNGREQSPTQYLKRRAKYARAEYQQKHAKSSTPVPKRKSDISMADATSDKETPSPKRIRGPASTHPEQLPRNTTTTAPDTVEYEDISAEVERRMKQHEERREHERKQALGMADKRKRMSTDSFTIELDGAGDKEVEMRKPSKKKSKRRHDREDEEEL